MVSSIRVGGWLYPSNSLRLKFIRTRRNASNASAADPFDAGQVARREDCREAGLDEPVAACRGLVVSVLAEKPPASREVARRLRDDTVYAFVAGRPGDERLPRLEAQIAFLEMTIGRGHVGRIGDDDFEAAAGERFEPVAFPEFDRHPVPLRIVAGDRER